MKISVEANRNKFEFDMCNPDKVAIDSICRIIRAQAPHQFTHWDVYLQEPGLMKINVIKAIRTITHLGLKEAKEMAETPNALLAKRVDEKQAEVWRNELEAACNAKLRFEGVK